GRRHTRFSRDWSSDVCSSDLECLSDAEMEKVQAEFVLSPVELGLDFLHLRVAQALAELGPELLASLQQRAQGSDRLLDVAADVLDRKSVVQGKSGRRGAQDTC